MFNYNTKNLLQKVEPAIRFATAASGKNICYNNVNRNFHLNHKNEKLIVKNYAFTQKQQVRFNYFSAEVISVHNYMKEKNIYSKTVSPSLIANEDLQLDQIDDLLQKSWISMSNEEILKNFEFLSHYAHKNGHNLEDPKYQGVLEVLNSKCQEFADQDIRQLLICLELWSLDKNQPNFKSLYLAIDKKLLKRYEAWSIDEVLHTNHLFFKLRIQRALDFTWFSLRKLGVKVKYMTAENLIHYAFLLKVNRTVPINMYEVEYYTEQNIRKLTANELGITAMAFIKYETVFRSKNFIHKIIDKVIKEIDVISDISLAAIIKILRCHDDTKSAQAFERLFEAFETQVDKRMLTLLSQIFLLQRKVLIHHKNLTLKIIQRFEKEIEKASPKDIERILLTLFTFNYDLKTTPLYLLATKELLKPEKAEKLAVTPGTLVYATEYLLGVTYLPEELLNIVMQPEYIDKVAKGDNYNLNREYLSIDYMLEIEHPEYTGPRLSEDLRVFLRKRYGATFEKTINKFQKALYIHKMIPDMANIFQKMFESETATYVDALLPHYSKTMIVLCFDGTTNEVISLEKKLLEYSVDSIKYAPKDGNKWYALVAGPRINVERITQEPFGYIKCQMRQLEKIGYIPIFVPFNTWLNLKNDDEKEDYLRKLLDR